MQASGFINLNKPRGLTSHDCVGRLRRILKTKKVGHAGTLDPMATGVLPIAINRATKFIQVHCTRAMFLDKAKAYEGTIRFGITTDTDDITGNVLHEDPVPWLTRAQVEIQLQTFVGHITQRPPLISAFRKDGERMYKLARAGAVCRTERCADPQRRDPVALGARICPKRLSRGTRHRPLASRLMCMQQVSIHVACSEGTYIRSIARECGERLASSSSSCVGGTLSTLHRVQSSGFTSATSLTLEDIAAHVESGTFAPSPIASGLPHLPTWVVDPAMEFRWRNGMAVWWDARHRGTDWPAATGEADTLSAHRVVVAVYNPSHEFLGVTTLERMTDEARSPSSTLMYAVTGPRLFAN
ncbi:Aste57867_20095 [Aphanomyces stellatus]|uniref:tRNA pseudouridine(55) synthase n=1 Tax=Aphanomyces stellatus TaxID=120398 RepID=A0A485LEV7_9STRA|nr:hypothetical protein As57867_020029 [Aphanomyces stellatus]VFT96790.1 Aste57867_20095 [Aphanomyces stellatus]